MTTTRILSGSLLVVLAAAGSVAAQSGAGGLPPYSPPGRAGSGLVPSVAPAGWQDTAPPPRTSPGRADSLERMTTQPAPGTAPGDPVGTLSSQPYAGSPGLPPGAYGGPLYQDYPGCCGPLDGGKVGYEVYVNTGPNFVFGNPAFTGRLNTGWGVVGGGRSLLYNRANDAAWVIDLGLGYTYNRGVVDDFADLFIRQPSTTNQQTGVVTRQPDLLLTSRIRAIHRTSVNYAVGRDVWLWGPGAPGSEAGWNLRVGSYVGGRWGTSHVDVDIQGPTPPTYFRRQNVFHGLFVGAHANVEVPVGGAILFGGLRVEYGYDWTNLVPPLNGDIQNVNLLITTGVRF